jgi:hypothetical protein
MVARYKYARFPLKPADGHSGQAGMAVANGVGVATGQGCQPVAKGRQKADLIPYGGLGRPNQHVDAPLTIVAIWACMSIVVVLS